MESLLVEGIDTIFGIPGVAISSCGPGALNTLTAMATAYNDNAGLHI